MNSKLYMKIVKRINAFTKFPPQPMIKAEMRELCEKAVRSFRRSKRKT